MENEKIDLEILYNRINLVLKKLEDFEKRLNGFEAKFDRMNNSIRPVIEKVLGGEE